MLQKISNSKIDNNVSDDLKDKNGFWIPITYRARILVYSNERVKKSDLTTYEDLVNEKWKGRILVRSSSNAYNQALMSSIVANLGSDAASDWSEGIVKNFARDPKGSDRDQVKAIAAGQGDIAIVNSYYIGLLLSSEKKEFATSKKINTLEQAIKKTDVFIGLSKANMLTSKMLLSMAKNPIVFAMANPDPEIRYDLAMKTRDDIIMATGRSDYPNQVNNVLGFPFIFRGALDVKATKINDKMKMAAVKALASLAKETVPEFVNIAYDKTKLAFGKNYIIPKPFDPRLITKIPPQVAKAAMESGVAQDPIKCWEEYEEQLHSRLGNDKKIVRLLTNRAKANPKSIIFAEADHLDVLKAAQIVHEEGIGYPILLGDKEVILELKSQIEFEDDIPIIDPKADEELSNRELYGQKYWEIRRRKGVTLFEAVNKMKQRNLYSAMMLLNGDADALISGYSRSYPVTVKPMLEVIGKATGINKVATTNLMITSKGPLFLSDTSINIDPSAKDLAIIAKMTAETVRMFGMEPNIAMLSYSNFGSSNHAMALKVNHAVKFLHRNFPELNVDGEVQSDFALNKEMFKDKFSYSKLSGKNVNTLIFPNLDSANTNYKVIKELDGALSIGPIMMGMSKAVHVLQLGASVEEMVNMSAVAVVDAQKKAKLKE